MHPLLQSEMTTVIFKIKCSQAIEKEKMNHSWKKPILNGPKNMALTRCVFMGSSRMGSSLEKLGLRSEEEGDHSLLCRQAQVKVQKKPNTALENDANLY